MHQPPYRFAERPPDRPSRWPLPRILLWVMLFAAMGTCAFLILAR